jgi:hypothetical protein
MKSCANKLRTFYVYGSDDNPYIIVSCPKMSLILSFSPFM